MVQSGHLAMLWSLLVNELWRRSKGEQPLSCFAVSYLDRVHGVHHCVLQYASHCSRCHVGRHGDMRWQALVVPVTVERLLVFAFVLRHIQRCHRTVRAQLHAWGALPEALPYQTTLKRGNGGMDNHNIITTGVPAPIWRNDRGRGLY